MQLIKREWETIGTEEVEAGIIWVRAAGVDHL